MLVQAGSQFTASGLLMLALHLIDVPEDCHAVYADEVARLDNAQLGLVCARTSTWTSPVTCCTAFASDRI